MVMGILGEVYEASAQKKVWVFILLARTRNQFRTTGRRRRKLTGITVASTRSTASSEISSEIDSTGW
jgi:hypothetical protein